MVPTNRTRALLAFAALFLLGSSLAAPSCDEEYGKFCPEEMPGKTLVACLAKQRAADADSISAGCGEWLKVLEACSTDMEEHCAGNEGDAFMCLTEWKKDSVSDSCKASFPAKPEEPKVEKKKGRKSKKSRAKEKRRKHKKHLEEYEKMKEEEAEKEAMKSGEAPKKKKKKSKKKKKKSKKDEL